MLTTTDKQPVRGRGKIGVYIEDYAFFWKKSSNSENTHKHTQTHTHTRCTPLFLSPVARTAPRLS